jgi:hypothetical protein
MELYEKYPEYPPLQMARQGLMDSPEFEEYRKSRGYNQAGAEDFAFKQFKRDLRLKANEGRRHAQAEARHRIATGLDEGRGFRFKQRTPEPTRKDIVFGGGEEAKTKDESGQ